MIIHYLLINHLILIYKYIYFIYVYNSRNRSYLNIEHLEAAIDVTKNIEEEMSKHEPKKDPSILRNGIFTLRKLFKRCNGG